MPLPTPYHLKRLKEKRGEMKWIKEIISVLGRAEADHLRDIIFQQYRGHEDLERRQWSGLQSHLVNISCMLISFDNTFPGDNEPREAEGWRKQA